MCSAVSCKLILYADDSALLASGNDINVIESTLSSELENLNEWLIDNKLSLHLGKTESILFGTGHKLKKHPDLRIHCKGSSIKSTTCVKYLGAKLDSTLSGESMCQDVINKVNCRLKFLYRKARCLDYFSRKLLANSLILCIFDYACCSWYGGLSVKSKNMLQVCQNKVVRFVLDLHPHTSLNSSHFLKMNWLPLKDRISFLKLSHSYRILNGMAPNYLSSALTFLPHSYSTRSSLSSVFVPRFSTSQGLKTFQYTSCILWNSLPARIKKSPSLSIFKTSLKKFSFTKLKDEESSAFLYF